MKKPAIAALLTAAVLAIAAPGYGSTQTVTADVASTLSMGTAPSSSIANWALAATGANTTSGGTVQITANQPYTLSVSADKSRMSEYDTGTNAYVDGGKTLSSDLSVIAAATSGTGVGATAVVGTSTTLATGTGLGTDAYSVTLSQPTLITDARLGSGKTYRIVLTYSVASTL